METKEILEQIYPKLDIESLLPELSPKDKGGYYHLFCPNCGKKEATISKKGKSFISCYRENRCGYAEPIWNYVLKNQAHGDKKLTLQILAKNAGVELGEVEISHTCIKKTIDLLNEVRYEVFDTTRPFTEIKINDYMEIYSYLSKEEKVKMVYSFLYRYSLQTDQIAKIEYYKKRGIDDANKYLPKIGFLSKKDISKVVTEMKRHFHEEDLIEFGLLKEKNPKHFKFYSNEGFCVVPSFDLYTNLITGLMLRNIGWTKYYMRAGKRIKNEAPKEFQVSRSHIVKPIPFALTYENIIDSNTVYIVTEGHVDGISLPRSIIEDGKRKNVCPISIPGVNGFREEFFGYLKGKKAFLALDQDRAGHRAAFGYYLVSVASKTSGKIHKFKIPLNRKDEYKKLMNFFKKHNMHGTVKKHNNGLLKKMQKAGVEVLALVWDKKEGKDINELKQRNKLKMAFKNIQKV
jgi:DNA primase